MVRARVRVRVRVSWAVQRVVLVAVEVRGDTGEL